MDRHLIKATQAVVLVKVKELAKEYGFTIDEMQELCESPFRFLKEVIENPIPEERYFPTVKIPGFCTFYVKTKKQYALQNKFLDKKLNKEEDES